MGRGEEAPVQQYVTDVAGTLDNVTVIYYDAKANNPIERVIALRRPGTGDFANSPSVTLQAHLDMVCFPNMNIFPGKLLRSYTA